MLSVYNNSHIHRSQSETVSMNALLIFLVVVGGRIHHHQQNSQDLEGKTADLYSHIGLA